MDSTSVNRPELEIEKLRVEINKIIAETANVNRETAKINREIVWYPLVVAGTIVGGAAALGALIAKLF